MESNKPNLMQVINAANTPLELVENIEVGDRFKHLYKIVHGIKDTNVADSFYTAEKFHFLKLISDSKSLQQCTKLSLYGIFMDVAVSGLSFDPSMKHLYIVPFNTNVGTKQEPRWEKRAALQISGQGELLLRQLQGQVKYVDNPVVVYDGDEFQYGTRDGKTIVNHMATLPRRSDTIIAAFIKIVRHDDSYDYKVMSIEDIQNLRKFSKDKDSLAWTSGLKGMVEAKVIKHAFKNYPKLRLGELSRLSSDTIDEEVQMVTGPIDYGLQMPNEQEQLPEATGQYQPTMVVTPAEQSSQQQHPQQQQQQQPAELDF